MGFTNLARKIKGILKFVCPRCRRGKLFPTNTWSFSKSFEMHKKCEACGLDFEPEPGFYYGAMFLSYIFTAFFTLGLVMFLHWVLKWSMSSSFIVLLLILGILFVWFFRVARSAWLGIVTKYSP